MLGLEKGTVRVVAYKPEWARLFEEERRRLRAALGAFALRIEHVGSTSVEGLAAKPIIDIAVAVGDLSRVESCVGALAALGYEHKGENGVPGRRYFTKGQPRTHHLHMFELESEGWRTHIQFRDRLRAHPSLVEEYAKLKRRLAGEFPTDRGAYTEAKAPFIKRVLESLAADAPEE